MAIFVPRSQWGSVYGTGGSYMAKVSDVTCHHTPGQEGGGVYEQARGQVRAIEYGHVVRNGWSAIGYTWLVSGPYAFEGRGWWLSGAHAPGGNTSSIGIAFILDGRNRQPTAQEWQTAADIVHEGQRIGAITRAFNTYGHRDYVATECPAALVYDNLNRLVDAYNAPTSLPTNPPTGVDAMTPQQEEFFRKKLDYVQEQAINAIHAGNNAARLAQEAINASERSRQAVIEVHKQVDAIVHARPDGRGGYEGGPYAAPLMELLHGIKEDLDILADEVPAPPSPPQS